MAEHKYKVGEKVRVRPDLKEGDRFRIYVFDDMVTLAGKIVTIKKADGTHKGCPKYKLYDDEDIFFWTEDLFVPVWKHEPEIGDKVRVRSDLTSDEHYGGVYTADYMVRFADKVVTISDKREDGRYTIDEDEGDWIWHLEMFVPVEAEPKKRKLKVGDKVRVRPDLKVTSYEYDDCLTTTCMCEFKGKIVTIKSVEKKENRYTIVESGNNFLWSSEMFVLDGDDKREDDCRVQEIIITTDGKKTTATYRNNGNTVVAFTRCSPDDTFDFAEGAKIAFSRLWDDEEEDKPEHQGYNGKIVCIQRGYNNISDPLLGLTVGKVYTVTDGRLTFDDGHTSACKYFTIEALCIGTGHKFIPLVE